MKHIISLNKLIFKQLVKLLHCNKTKFLFQSLMGFIVFSIFTNYNDTLVQTIVVNSSPSIANLGNFPVVFIFLINHSPPPLWNCFPPVVWDGFIGFFSLYGGKQTIFWGESTVFLGEKYQIGLQILPFGRYFFIFFPPNSSKTILPREGGGKGCM